MNLRVFLVSYLLKNISKSRWRQLANSRVDKLLGYGNKQWAAINNEYASLEEIKIF
jgi:hypothetical protein